MKNKNFGGMAICEKLFNWIRSNLQNGKIILEFGSGTGTIELTKYYTVYSVEQDKEWIGFAQKSNYIYAPIKNGWYDSDIVFNNIPNNYDLILIDGPKGHGNRGGIINHLNKLNTDVPIIIDDITRPKDDEHAILIANKLKKAFKKIYSEKKGFMIIN